MDRTARTTGVDSAPVDSAPVDAAAVDRLAAELHQGQVDLGGAPYVEHPRAVARIVAARGGTADQRLAALLHDVVEDTDCTLDQLAAWGIPVRVRELVDAMTRRPGEAQEDYLARVAGTPGAIDVKRADIAHNTDPERLAQLEPATRDRLRRKYDQALATLARLEAGVADGEVA